MKSSNDMPVIGQQIAFTAHVSITTPGAARISGTVDFFDGTTLLATRHVNSAGDAVLKISSLSIGGHSITAVYNGNAKLAGSKSDALTQAVAQGSTQTVLHDVPATSQVGQPVTLFAYVYAVAPSHGQRTGTVTFYDGTTVLGTVNLGAVTTSLSSAGDDHNASLGYSGRVTLTTSSLSVGTHAITAVYSGDADFVGSTSTVVNEIVVLAKSHTDLTSSALAANAGDAVTLTATVRANNSKVTGVPTGTVEFFDGTTLLGKGTLDSKGVATLTTSSLSAGTHVITVNYDGDANFTISGDEIRERIVPLIQIATTTIAGAGTANGGAKLRGQRDEYIDDQHQR